ncbi:MAG: hypothetical protein K0U72_14530 [Gammaproteobacteria bacterium]|nr:hypothetical protein [Gammaproteobacteria bacterium]
MVANQITLELTPEDTVLEMLERMEALAANGEWDRTERLASRLKSAVLDIPEQSRQSTVVAVSHSLERVQTMALSSRSEVKDKLSGIRRGQVATRAYGQPQS